MSSSITSIKSLASLTSTESLSAAAAAAVVSSSSKNSTAFETMSKTSSPENVVTANFKLLLLVMMVLQNSATVLVGRYTRAGGIPKDQLYDVNHLLFICEFTKFVLSCLLEFHTTNGLLWQSLQIHIFSHPLDALKILVPALLYLVQNTLLYVALGNLTAPLFQVTYQGKLVTTAIVSVLMLARKYSFQQWICLVTLSLGVAIVVLGEQQQKDKATTSSSNTQNLALGLTSVTISCLSSALAGVYFEKVLKKPAQDKNAAAGGAAAAASHAPPSLWMRNIQLAFFSFVIAAGQGWWKQTPESASRPYLHGFTTWVWILVALQAGGGLLVAAVIKYADNVLKGLATGVSVVLATALSMILFGTPLTGQFTMGAFLILSSVYVFSNPVKLPGSIKQKDGTEMKNLLPK